MKKIIAPEEDFLRDESALAWLFGEYRDNGMNGRLISALGILSDRIINDIHYDGETFLYQRLSQTMLGGFTKGNRLNVEASLYLRAGESSGQGAERGAAEKGRITLLKEFAKAADCWVDDIGLYCRKNRLKEFEEGGEAKVYLNEDNTCVVKCISLNYYDDPLLAIDRINLHNSLFPETNLSIMAFGADKDGNFVTIARQAFVQGEAADPEMLADKLGRIGFEKNRYLKFSDDDYMNPFVCLGDLHDENVIYSPGGTINVIDCDLRLNVPELGYGGRYIIPPLKASRKGIERADEIFGRALTDDDYKTRLILPYHRNDNLSYKKKP